jgi:hypothetical protein
MKRRAAPDEALADALTRTRSFGQAASFQDDQQRIDASGMRRKVTVAAVIVLVVLAVGYMYGPSGRVDAPNVVGWQNIDEAVQTLEAGGYHVTVDRGFIPTIADVRNGSAKWCVVSDAEMVSREHASWALSGVRLPFTAKYVTLDVCGSTLTG